MFNNTDFKNVMTFNEFENLTKEFPQKFILPSFNRNIRNDLLGVVDDNGNFRPIKFTFEACKVLNR